MDEYGRTELHYSSDPDVIAGLIKSGLNINQQDHNGWCPLHFYVQDNNIEAVKVAIQNGADVNLQDKHGNGPLWTATMNARGDFKCIKALLEAKADPNCVNKHGRSPLDMANTIKEGLETVFQTV